MLAVIPANVDIATQEILTMAEDADQDGHRTLRVLTKPDLVDRGAESSVIALVKGESHKLTGSSDETILPSLSEKRQGFSRQRNIEQSIKPMNVAQRVAINGSAIVELCASLSVYCIIEKQRGGIHMTK